MSELRLELAMRSLLNPAAMQLVDTFRRKRWAQIAVANLRILVGFAFLPAGLKKLLGERFTDAANSGPFHDFLHGFHATGGFYRFVGAMQIGAALLLMTQKFAALGAAIMLPIISAIAAFCISTHAGVPTITTTVLLWLATTALLLWDIDRWSGMLRLPPADTTVSDIKGETPWAFCGLAIAIIYGVGCLIYGGVFRPKGMDWHEPGFYVLPAVAACPLITAVILWKRTGRE